LAAATARLRKKTRSRTEETVAYRDASDEPKRLVPSPDHS
jgi:hypothetical protein